MTLISVISRSHNYVIATGDTGSYVGDDFVESDRPKAFFLSNYVIALHGGCVAIGDDFRKYMARAVQPDSDIDDCYAAARDFIAWAEEHDSPGTPYPNPNAPGGFAARNALRGSEDGPGFNFVMSGFRRDGRTLLVQWEDEFADFDDDDQGEFTCGVPWATPPELVQEYFFSIPEAPPELHAAFAHVFMFHRTLFRRCPGTVTRELQGSILVWRDAQPPAALPLSCDVGDLVLSDYFAIHDLLRHKVPPRADHAPSYATRAPAS